MTLINIIKGSKLYRKAMDAVPGSVKPKLREGLYSLANLVQYGRADMFKSIAIETISICNRRCSYCPNSNDDLRNQRPQKEMDMNLYEKIIADLKDIKYKGVVALQHYGEPLLDSQLEQRIASARKLLPHVRIMIRSNGDHLTAQKYEALLEAGIDEVFVTNHNADGQLSAALRQLSDYLADHPEKKGKLVLRNGIKSLSNRGGLVEVPEEHRRGSGYCMQESYSMNIDVEGNVVMCSNDYLGQHRFGNVGERSVQEIWDQQEFREIRNKHRKGVFDEDVCKKCLYLS